MFANEHLMKSKVDKKKNYYPKIIFDQEVLTISLRQLVLGLLKDI